MLPSDPSGLASLFNHIARMRMLSHRSVMFMLLVQNYGQERDRYIAQLSKTLSDFNAIAELFTGDAHPDKSSRTAIKYLMKAKVLRPEHVGSVNTFATDTRGYVTALTAGHPIDLIEIADFVSTTLLTDLNAIVEIIQSEITKNAAHAKESSDIKNQVLARSIDELEKSTQMVVMISLNASIEASRFGPAGDGFKQIVKEIQSLSGHMGQVAAKLKAEVDV